MKKYRKEVSKTDLEEFPLSKYNGTIRLIETAEEGELAVLEIMKEEVIGIDTETKPSFKKGLTHQVALVQIATASCVFLFRINKMGLSDGLLRIFESNAILKIGIAIKDDIKDLQRLRYFKQKGFIDLNETAKILGYESIGARKLSALILGFRISKKQQTSNWEKEALSEQQLDYAATDAWICLGIFLRLKEMYPDLSKLIRIGS